MESNESNSTNRRTVLKKSITVGIPAIGVFSGVATANDEIENQGKQNVDDQPSPGTDPAESQTRYAAKNGDRLVGTQDNAMSDAELEQEMNDVEQKFGSDAVRSIWGGRDTDNLRANVIPSKGQTLSTNVSLVDTWKHEYNVWNDVGWKLAETTHYLNLYESNELDSNGDTIYFFKLLSYSEGGSGGYWSGKTTGMRHWVDIQDYSVVTTINPDGVISLGGSGSTTVSLSVGPASVGSTFNANGGSMEPHIEQLEYGAGGAFGWEFDGNVFNTAALSGIADVRSDAGYDWESHSNTWADVGNL